MASGSAGRVYSGTLTGSTVDTVLLTTPGTSVTVTNDTGTSPIWFTVSEPGGACPTPTVGGANCFSAGSVAGIAVPVRHPGYNGVIVQLISAGTPTYTVTVTGNTVNA